MPAEVDRNREKLSAKNFARWQAESRWRPLVSKVSHRVMSDWADRNVKPTREEIQEHYASQAKEHLQAYDTEEGHKQLAMMNLFSLSAAVEWSTAKALYEKHGGRVAFSSFGGCISIDGRNALLKEYAAAGKIQFQDPEIENEFWARVEDPSVLDVTVSDPKRLASRFATPPWEGWGAKTAKILEKKLNSFKSSGGENKQPDENDSADNTKLVGEE